MRSDTVRLLVTPDREEADAAALVLPGRLGLDQEPRVIREALAGDDDAEDAQWLIEIAPPPDGWDEARLARLDELAAEHDGWIEVADEE